jgi:dihydrofolate synthase / folylpolyglutamate synthase
MLYNDALAFLYGLTNYELSQPDNVNAALKLERMVKLLAALGDPHKNYRIIHVAGTKGKGSTCAMLESCLRAMGLRTGLFISPHLSSFRERMRVNGELMPVEVVGILTDKVKAAMEDIPGITTFEAITAMALLHFARENCEWVVLEVGLGGRLDSTNVVTPAASVITSISYDHMQWLGSTLTEIAGEKAGIIKQGVPVISHQQVPEAAAVIERVAHEKGAQLTIVGRHWRWTPGAQSLQKQDFEIKQVSLIRSKDRPFVNDLEGRYEIGLLGKHQIENASTVIATLDALRVPLIESGAKDFGAKTVRDGLRDAVWAGRFEILRVDPPLIIDGAHNVDSVNKLAITLVEMFPGKRWTFIFGGYRDKAIEGMIKALNPRSNRWIFTRVKDNPRAMSPDELLAVAKSVNARSPQTTATVGDALAQINDGNEAVCVCGSIALTGEARVQWALQHGQIPPPSDA